MTEFILQLTQWLNTHPQWIGATIALFALLESLVMVGVIIPGVALLFAISVLAGGSQTPVYICLLAAMGGAIAGDISSFFLGRYAHPWALKTKLFRKHPQWISRGEKFFHKYGVYSVIIGRFIGPLRPVVPFVAGMLSMPVARFVIINFASALAWAPVYILPGCLLGNSTQHFTETDFSQHSQYIGLGVAAIFALGTGLLLWVCAGLKKHSQTSTETNSKIEQPGLTTTFICLGLFCVLAIASSQTEWLRSLDLYVSQLTFSWRSSGFDDFAVAYTLAGDSANLLLLSLPIWIWIWRNQSKLLAASWAISFIATALLSQLIKILLALPRPELLLNPSSSFAFPSAHTSNSTFFLFTLAWWLSLSLPLRLRFAIQTIATIAALAMATSRLYLGVHWLSDIAAGLCLGLAGAQLLIYINTKQQASLRPPSSAALTKLLLLSTAIASIYIFFKHPYAIALYQPLITTS